jgi:hypothetical protein
MKRYYLTILTPTGNLNETVDARYFDTTTDSNTSSGFYSFYNSDELFACYPINRTIITRIEKI